MDGDTEIRGERIAKRLSRAGICSRREAERWIANGRVTVDGTVITTPATLVTSSTHIAVDGKEVAEPEQTRLWRYHKPAGVICTTSDPEGRPTVFDRLPAKMPRTVLIGRLDIASEGLLLLTNDGEVARKLELPATGWLRRYRVRVHGRPDEEQLAALEDGVTIDGIAYGPIRAKLDRQTASNAWITIGLREGKNREVRRVMEHLGLTVNRLIRLGFGPFQLGNLPSDSVREVSAKVVAEQLSGAKLKGTTVQKEPKRTGKRPLKGAAKRAPKKPADRKMKIRADRRR
jgi:23S rRNA pseudouridine2605 synthase